MIVTSPPRTFTISSINEEERDLLRAALLGLSEKLSNEIRSSMRRADEGVTVEPFLTGIRRELESVNKMIDMLYGT